MNLKFFCIAEKTGDLLMTVVTKDPAVSIYVNSMVI